MKNYSLSVVIPAYNEERNIEDVIFRSLEVLKSLTDQYEVLVMNDASQDRTKEILDRLVAQEPVHLRVFHHSNNKGTNLSLIELFRKAQCDFIFFLPADKQILPEVLSRYLEVVETEGADIVLGWRRRRADPFYRSFLNGFFRFFLRYFLGLHYHDAAASDLYRRSVLDQIQMESRGRLLQAEIAAKATALGYRVKELIVEHYPRTAGKQTGVSPKAAWLSLVDLIQIGPKIRALNKAK